MYQTLYRKYRPQKFGDIMGQEIIIKILKNSILNQHISHAYLFVGPRGTGKTSTAKIFARVVNCLNSSDGDLCNVCEMCKISGNKECLDIIEIDAASNNGVDEIRSLREKVNLVPSELKYKIYIIDEVHMLTIQAFNALLKTLEEPPEHIIFILATTDPQKIPETIISRCQCYNFSRISENSIVKNLLKVCESENIDCDKEVLEQIAIISDGGMRDALSMLDKLSSYENRKIVLADFLTMNGLVAQNDLIQFIHYISENRVIDVINFIEQWNSKGNNLIQIMIQLLNYLKEVLVDAYINNRNDINVSLFQRLANLINEKMFDIKKSSNPKIYIEILLLDFLNNGEIISREIISDSDYVVKKQKDVSIENQKIVEKKINLDKSNNIVEKSINKANNSIFKGNDLICSNIKEIMKIRVNNAFISATKTELNKDKVLFQRLGDYTFDQKIGYLVCTLLDGDLRLSSDDYIVISYEYDSIVMENLVRLEDMENVLIDILNINKKLVIISNDEWKYFADNYVKNKKSGLLYQYENEPELMFEYSKKMDIKNVKSEDKDGATSLFGDIVELY